MLSQILEVTGQSALRSETTKEFLLSWADSKTKSKAEVANKGVSKEIRKKLAGHTTGAHDRYTHFELGAIRGALKDFPSVLGDQT